MDSNQRKQKRLNRHIETLIMPRVSAYASRKEWEAACWHSLVGANTQLNRIVSPYERHNIAVRAAAIHLLSIGMSYRNIGSELWLSPQTISVIKKGIREAGYRSYAERGITERKRKMYSTIQRSKPRRHIKIGIPRKTKYGTVYL